MTPAFATDVIEVTAVAGVPFTITHSTGRPVLGWLLVWQDAPGLLYVSDSRADSRRELTLTPTASFNARIVLLS